MLKSQSRGQSTERLSDFNYLADNEHYFDAACQSLRPQPVIDALTDYYHTYNACGGRVKYAWGKRVDEMISDTRQDVLKFLKLSPRHYSVSFTLNTTVGLNLLLEQLPANKFKRVITSHIEHNSVFLPTMTLAKRLNLPREVLERADDGSLIYKPNQLDKAIVVVNTTSNIDGRLLNNINELTRDVHNHGGIVIIDAAQTMAHNYSILQKTAVDAICFSAHKMYSASLGVIVARHELINSLRISIIGGGMVTDVTEHDFTLLPDDLSSRLEPGLQAWGEIIALRRAIQWLISVRPAQQKPTKYITALSEQLFNGLQAIPELHILNSVASPVISVYSEKHDAHRLAIFLSGANIMVRSGYFCAHHYLKEKLALPPLLRFSIGLHSTEADIQFALKTLDRFVKEL